MAVLGKDSFDHLATADIGIKWAQQSNVTIGAVGRNSTNGARISASGSNGFLVMTAAPGSPSAGGVGVAVKVSSLFNSLSGNELLQIQQADGTQHVAIGLTVSGLLEAKRGTTVVATSSAGLTAGTFYYLEAKWNINDSTGTIDIRLNGTSVLSFSGDTRNGGDGTWSRLVIQNGSNNASLTVDLDDFILWDTSGSANNDFIGPVRIVARFPNGAGNSTDFTPSAGANHENVDETSQDGDTTYNSEATPGDHDTYAMQALGVSGTIKSLQINMVVRSDGAGSETIASMLRIGGTDYQGTSQGISTSYLNKRQVYDVSPATGVAFTEAEFDAAEVGLKLVS